MGTNGVSVFEHTLDNCPRVLAHNIPIKGWNDQGRFRIEGLIPGLKYNLALMDASGASEFERNGLAFANLVLKPGETKDLGDAKLQAFPKEK